MLARAHHITARNLDQHDRGVVSQLIDFEHLFSFLASVSQN